MKQLACVMVLAAAAACMFGYVAVLSGGGGRALAVPPLSLEGYLDEKLPEAPKTTVESKVDNTACFVCHGNYEGEELVTVHATEEVGCIDCHGESLAHRNDEDNITPPDKMYALADVDGMCGECHDMHDVSARDVIERWHERCPAKSNPDEIVCTDCHFGHRLAFRTVWWDKKTGDLIIRKEGQRTKAGADATSTGQ